MDPTPDNAPCWQDQYRPREMRHMMCTSQRWHLVAGSNCHASAPYGCLVAPAQDICSIALAKPICTRYSSQIWVLDKGFRLSIARSDIVPALRQLPHCCT